MFDRRLDDLRLGFLAPPPPPYQLRPVAAARSIWRRSADALGPWLSKKRLLVLG